MKNQEQQKGRKINQGVDIYNKMFTRKDGLDDEDCGSGRTRKITPKKKEIVMCYQEDIHDDKQVPNIKLMKPGKVKVENEDIMSKQADSNKDETKITRKADQIVIQDIFQTSTNENTHENTEDRKRTPRKQIKSINCLKIKNSPIQKKIKKTQKNHKK